MTDWIEWGGGKCPVSDETFVDVIQRNGDGFFGNEAEWFEWEHDPLCDEYDITAYRIVTP